MGVLSLVGNRATESLTQVIAFTNERVKVLADDVANIDTPGYRMRDLDVERFNKTLSRAIAQSSRQNPNSSSIGLPSIDDLDTNLGSSNNPNAADLRGIVFHDDNDRSIEKLMVQVTKNAGRHAQAATLLRKQVELLQLVISENVR